MYVYIYMYLCACVCRNVGNGLWDIQSIRQVRIKFCSPLFRISQKLTNIQMIYKEMTTQKQKIHSFWKFIFSRLTLLVRKITTLCLFILSETMEILYSEQMISSICVGFLISLSKTFALASLLCSCNSVNFVTCP